ncbi:peptidase [Cellulosimicrobium sp. AB352]|uniref:peptidase n=1 Tax=Cellulosimicrobium TaxID=157920 RepID=UPI0036FA42A0
MSTSTGRRAAGRATAAAALAATAALLAGPAHAAEGDTYVPTEPSMRLTTLAPVCESDAAYLDYAIEVEGTDHDTATVTWINPDGESVVQSGLPLSGRLLWPGAVVDDSGRGVDWPGWRLEDGRWVEGDEYDWVRPSVDVRFEVNPHVVVTTVYPPASPDCATNPPGLDDPAGVVPVSSTVSASAANPGLAETGVSAALYAGIAAVLAAAGTAVVIASRRTRRG